jgi:F-type H+-transporting ATPase subunit gamma
MPSLKTLRNRIASVKSTQKITKAMKMVAAAKLRRAQAQADAARPYAARVTEILSSLTHDAKGNPNAPSLLVGTGASATHLLVVVTADRGLAGPFNAQVGRSVRLRTRELEGDGKQVKLFTVGRKGRDYLRRDLADRIVADISFVGKKSIEFADAESIAQRIIAEFDRGSFDICTIIYNRFVSVIFQRVAEVTLIPTLSPDDANDLAGKHGELRDDKYEIEPEDDSVLAALLPRYLAIQIYRALLESAAGEQGARMTAMDR